MRHTEIRRSRTALSRSRLSRPLSTALADGVLHDRRTVFDYGCGKGDDLKHLTGIGVEARGWDPAFAPEAVKSSADVVNLGFVVNVIEDGAERVACLREAWSLATEVLVVSARLEGEVDAAGFVPYADGALTQRGTFQKFFQQDELRSWVEGALGEPPVAAAPGVLYVFRNPQDRETFLASRYRRRVSAPRLRVSDAMYAEFKSLLAPLEAFMLARGRLPDDTELVEAPEIRVRFGSLTRAFNVVRRVTGDAAWELVREGRREDLLVYGALSRFGGRPRWSDLPPATKLDVRAFFSNYKRLCEAGDELLYAVGRRAELESAMRSAPVGKLTPSALYVHRTALDSLPPILRAYEGCGRTLAGDIDGSDVIKLSRADAKVSYLSYPTFDSDPHPPLTRSVIVYPGVLRIHYRNYAGSSNPPILHRKEEFVGSDYPGHAKYERLTRQEERAGLFDDVERIGFVEGWNETLQRCGVALKGHRVIRSANQSLG